MLKLTYTRKKDRFQTVAVLGDADGIRDLFWQLTRNHQSQDGTEIGTVKVHDLDGVEVTSTIMINHHGAASRLSSLDR